MVIDAAKGIETQTRKLFEVCRLRDVPIVTFINKMDREGRDPFELLDEIEHDLQLDVTPASWPIGMGREFRGCYDLFARSADPDGAQPRRVPAGGHHASRASTIRSSTSSCPRPRSRSCARTSRWSRGLCPTFDLEIVPRGPPDAGVLRQRGQQLRRARAARRARASSRRRRARSRRASAPVEPTEPKVSGFVFKIQANMDPKHRDRIAFVRLARATSSAA